jgi:hypothetical protein
MSKGQLKVFLFWENFGEVLYKSIDWYFPIFPICETKVMWEKQIMVLKIDLLLHMNP